MASDRKLANAVGGKSARACDNCVRKRARWYCAADDAFLCQSCDSYVHSANPLARRHERVRLKTATFKSLDIDEKPSSLPSWHKGFTRKARRPRQKRPANNIHNPLHLVPEIYGEEHSPEENEEKLLYRVPIFDPFVAELCTSANPNEPEPEPESTVHNDKRLGFGPEADFSQEMSHLQGFLSSEMDLLKFAADVESLLGKGLEDESIDMEGLGLLDCDDSKVERKANACCSLGSHERILKVEVEEIGEVGNNNHHGELFDLERESFELNFDYDSPINGEEECNMNKVENLEPIIMNGTEGDGGKVYEEEDIMKKIFLRLDYEGLMSAWDDQKSPWTTGERPDLNSDDCWPDCMGTCATAHLYGDTGMMSGHVAAMADGGREARVSRYREKRRTRLFSKKIRYEVRKLNAEKRPRMKGRFVKRANLMAPPPAAAAAFTLLNK